MWDRIEINIQNIEYSNGRSVLIKMPNKSIYGGFKFWFPLKLVREGSHSYARSLSFTDEWEFKLFKNGQGQYNRDEILDEKIISAEELKECFEDRS